MPTVNRLSTAPVKSLALNHPDEIRLEESGAVDDRRFFLVDGDADLFMGDSFGSLVQVRAEYRPAGRWLALRFPDQTVVEGEVPEGGGGSVVIDFHGRPVPAREVEGPWSAAMSRFTGRPVRLLECHGPGRGWDVHPVTIVSVASVRELARQGRHGGELDPARFRMLMDLDGCAPHEEDTWAGRRVRIGEGVLRVAGPVPRCVVTTRDPDTGLKDFETLRVIRRYRGRGADGKLDFGMYADVEEPGTIRVRDPVEVLSD